jgi:hypothetical protein
VPGWHWPAVRAVADERRWLVLVDPRVGELAEVSSTFPWTTEAVNADGALEWVRLIAGLYVKALRGQTTSRAARWPIDATGSDAAGWWITIPGTPVAAAGSTLVEAAVAMVRELRQYAADWAALQRIGPSRVENWWLVRLVEVSTEDQLAEWVKAAAGPWTWVPREEFLARMRGGQADSGLRGDLVDLAGDTTDEDGRADTAHDESDEK